jgi:hypothetical protein
VSKIVRLNALTESAKSAISENWSSKSPTGARSISYCLARTTNKARKFSSSRLRLRTSPARSVRFRQAYLVFAELSTSLPPSLTLSHFSITQQYTLQRTPHEDHSDIDRSPGLNHIILALKAYECAQLMNTDLASGTSATTAATVGVRDRAAGLKRRTKALFNAALGIERLFGCLARTMMRLCGPAASVTLYTHFTASHE